MASRRQTRGSCVYCRREMTRSGLARHLGACTKRLEVIAAADKQRGRKQTLYHLQVQDAWDGSYWLHLEMRGNATLEDLDFYLRAIWLECCGHLSAFEIEPVRYTQLFYDGMAIGIEKSMRVQVQKLFAPGMRIPYEYDFGTTSELVIKVVGTREGKPTSQYPIVLMGRNKFDPRTCDECDQPAAWLCTECVWEHDSSSVFCGAHAREHEHEDMLMPIVNSPRTGMCGYDGPAEPPY